uniref:NADH dehydrogenase subunit 6 n=1 Tax=Satarupa monbeigi TaxID=425086 RepID=UPI002A83856F|nr:NADH dehydrogenase subunit 6 [Satarupa monbeigi]WNO18677.1 NADH dehydrogenase subunit 6 [Satarupa monbeigi]
MNLFLTILMIYISFYMFFMKHPLSMGLLILIQTMLICLISGLYIFTYWFSYILFLTFLGGLLVLFIYVSSMASNETFKTPPKNKLILLIMIFLLINIIFYLILFYLNKMNPLKLKFNSFEMNNLYNNLLFTNNNNNFNLTKLYNKQTYLLMLMMIIYLFITLVAVVKITNIFYGPLRSN